MIGSKKVFSKKINSTDLVGDFICIKVLIPILVDFQMEGCMVMDNTEMKKVFSKKITIMKIQITLQLMTLK